jgi:hypothetical protein|tara:strand:+ start:1085 stop:1312 length:228 start_codon:yes stop_codon:yes gene_type:complete
VDIQTRKIEFVQEFLKLQSENVIARFEKLLKSENKGFEPMTIEEFNKRIDKSMEDSKNDRVIEATELLNEIKEWR